jgi:pimeloyl-ACP methyl ester carboxylesterase
MRAKSKATHVSAFVETSHGTLSVEEAGSGALPVLFLHGNSLCKEVFAAQVASLPSRDFRAVSVDLPGHGASSDSPSPEASYTMPGYADAIVEVLEAMDIDHVAIVGWSLGGHVALELAIRFPGVVGLCLVGTPLVTPDWNQICSSFRPSPVLSLAGQEKLSPEEARCFVSATCTTNSEFLVNAVLRADGRARTTMMAALVEGRISNQLETAQRFAGTLAIVNGASEPLVDLSALNSQYLPRAMGGAPLEISGAGHAPHMTHPVAFNAVLHTFLAQSRKTGWAWRNAPATALSA